MSDFALGLTGFPALLLLIALRVPVAAAMFAVGLAGSWWLMGNTRMIDNQLKTYAFGTFTSYSLSIVPMFLLMAEFATRSGMSRDLFRAAQAWLGHLRGGLAMAAIAAAGGFGAVCGSSLATASSMGKVALPELRARGYSGRVATGAMAAGGTLGILIPPSIVLVIYAVLAEVNIAKLFAAAFVPGMFALLGYLVVIAILARIGGGLPAAPRAAWRQRWSALIAVWPAALIFLSVVGGIYAGVFSPTAAAAVGVAGTGIVAMARRTLDRAALAEALLSVAKTSAMIFFIVLAAGVFNSFLSLARVPQTLAEILGQSQTSPWMVLVGMLLLYVVLGTVMDSLAMIFLTVPIFVPIVTGLDFGLTTEQIGLWFGILVLVSAEVGLITPPVGLNLFVINAMARDVPISETYRGVLPFVLADVLRIAVLVAFPGISLFALGWLFP